MVEMLTTAYSLQVCMCYHIRQAPGVGYGAFRRTLHGLAASTLNYHFSEVTSPTSWSLALALGPIFFHGSGKENAGVGGRDPPREP